VKIDYDQKTEELSAANLYQMLEEYGRTRSKSPSEDSKEGTDAGDAAGPKPPGPMKIINPTLAEHNEFAARFEREADACSRLQHSNCIHVTDFGQDADGRLFWVMEYADGTLLNQAVVENPPTMQEVLQYTEQILHGLRHAHKEGLVHRDVKTEGAESK
jgi:serine/threonine protein kinase